VKTSNTVDPLGLPSLEKAVELPEAKSKDPPDDCCGGLSHQFKFIIAGLALTAEKVVDDTPLPHWNLPPLTPQLPLDDVMVKLLADPENVKVAKVCVDHVPRERSPPSTDPEWMAWIVPFVGKDPGV